MSEIIDRPKFREIRLQDNIPDEYDIVQLKMDGIWGALTIMNGEWKMQSRTGKIKAEG